MTNIFDLGGNLKDNPNLQNQLYELKANLPVMLEIARQKSEYQRERYISLKRQGFTEEQVIEIIKTERTPYCPQ